MIIVIVTRFRPEDHRGESWSSHWSALWKVYGYVRTLNKLPYVTYTLVATYGSPIRDQMLLPAASQNLCQYLYYVKRREWRRKLTAVHQKFRAFTDSTLLRNGNLEDCCSENIAYL